MVRQLAGSIGFARHAARARPYAGVLLAAVLLSACSVLENFPGFGSDASDEEVAAFEPVPQPSPADETGTAAPRNKPRPPPRMVVARAPDAEPIAPDRIVGRDATPVAA